MPSYTEFAVRSMLNSMPLYRQVGLPGKPSNAITMVFLHEYHFLASRSALEGINPRPVVSLVNTDESAATLSARLGERFLMFPYAMKQVHREVVVCTLNADRPMMNKMVMNVWRQGRNHYWLSDFPLPRPRPDLFDKEKERVIEILNKLSDEDSVNCYLARLKAIIFGNIAFLQMSKYGQYWHPMIRAQSGEIVCDGGIGTNLGTPLQFAMGVGATGRVFGFEPIKSMYMSLLAEAAPVPRIELVPYGLWSTPGEIDMYVAGNVSTYRKSEGATQTEKCQLTSIDVFFDQKRLTPNLIKLDIEGAETHALRGAEHTIRKSRPKLQVCLYHSVSDFLTIPLQVLDYYPGYQLFVGHHTPFFNECVLYARAPD